MRRIRKERYAQLLARMEHAIEARMRRWADWLQWKWDRLSLRSKYVLFILFCTSGACICAVIIVNALK